MDNVYAEPNLLMKILIYYAMYTESSLHPDLSLVIPCSPEGFFTGHPYIYIATFLVIILVKRFFYSSC